MSVTAVSSETEIPNRYTAAANNNAMYNELDGTPALVFRLSKHCLIARQTEQCSPSQRWSACSVIYDSEDRITNITAAALNTDSAFTAYLFFLFIDENIPTPSSLLII